MSEQITARELFNEATALSEKGLGIGQLPGLIFGGIGSAIASVPKKLVNKASDKMLDIFHFHDDNIVVPVSTQTLIGDNFSCLYESVKIQDYASSNGINETYLASDSSYETEMSTLISGQWMSYDLCSVNMKAAYEITLLSKKYANAYADGDAVNNNKLMDEYTDKMTQYKEYCVNNGLDWDGVLQSVSYELQAESCEYKEESMRIINGVPNKQNYDQNRIIANRAHNMVKDCMSEGVEDKFNPSLEGQMTYEETLDTNRSEDAAFFNRLAAMFKKKWESIMEFMNNSKLLHPIRTIQGVVDKGKQAVNDGIDRVDEFIAENRDQSNNRVPDESMISYTDDADSEYSM